MSLAVTSIKLSKKKKIACLKIALILAGTSATLGMLAAVFFPQQESVVVQQQEVADPSLVISQDQIEHDFATAQAIFNNFISAPGGMTDKVINEEAKRLMMAVTEFTKDKTHPCFQATRKACFETVSKNLKDRITVAGNNNDPKEMAYAVIQSQALERAISGQINWDEEMTPATFLVAIENMQKARQKYESLTTESKARDQLEKQILEQQEYEGEGYDSTN